ncbi:MAG: hypothetical protein AABZ32_03955 [Bacteroidota bacterium]
MSAISLIQNAKLYYERKISDNSTIGLIVSAYYLNPVFGIKIEPTFRFYFKANAPEGWYIHPNLSVGYFRTKETFTRRHYTYDANNILINTEIDEYNKEVYFTPVGFTLKAGHQNYFGKNKRFVFDYNFGLQYFPYNYYSRIDEQTEYYDNNGNKNVVETSHGGIRDAIPVNSLIWYFFGAGSVLNSNISIGYVF